MNELTKRTHESCLCQGDCYDSDETDTYIEKHLSRWVPVSVAPPKHGYYYCIVDGDSDNFYDTYYGPSYNNDTIIEWEGEITYWLDNVPAAPTEGEK